MVCSFFGHRKIAEKQSVYVEVKKEIRKLIIEKNVNVFYFGKFGDFDEICHKAVSSLKKEFSFIKRIFVFHDERFINKTRRPKYIKDDEYEDFIYFNLSYNYWYSRIYYRNCEMIKHSDIVIFYCKNDLTSGSYKALTYAKKTKKPFINLYLE